MSDAQTIYRLCLALGCAWGAWVLKFSSGVGDDSKADGVSNFSDGARNSHRVRRGSRVAEVHAMKDRDEHRGQIIDFLAARDRILMRRWAVANGFLRVR